MYATNGRSTPLFQRLTLRHWRRNDFPEGPPFITNQGNEPEFSEIFTAYYFRIFYKHEPRKIWNLILISSEADT